jgi:hypothetical protein
MWQLGDGECWWRVLGGIVWTNACNYTGFDLHQHPISSTSFFRIETGSIMEQSLNVAHLRRATIVCSTEASVWVLDRDLAERSGVSPHGDTMEISWPKESSSSPSWCLSVRLAMSYQCNVKYVNCISLGHGWFLFQPVISLKRSAFRFCWPSWCCRGGEADGIRQSL